MPDAPVLHTFFFADQMIRDSLTGKWSAIGLWDRFMFPKVPIVVGQIMFYLRISDVPAKFTTEVTLRSPREEVVAYRENTWELGAGQDRMGFECGGIWREITFGSAGRYTASVQIDGHQIGDLPLKVLVGKLG